MPSTKRAAAKITSRSSGRRTNRSTRPTIWSSSLFAAPTLLADYNVRIPRPSRGGDRAGGDTRSTDMLAAQIAPLPRKALLTTLASVWAGMALCADAPTRPGLAYQLTHAVTVDPSFSPDGQRMVYITLVAGREQLFTADADGTKAVQVTRDDYDHEDPAWAPDGARIAFVSLAGGGEVISMMDPDGSHVEVLS